MNDLENLKTDLDNIKRLLAKQKLVETLVHRQDMPKHDLVESIVHKQNSVELEKLLEKYSNHTIARVLEALSEKEIQTVWHHVNEARKEEILL